jgi:hypothetical protein
MQNFAAFTPYTPEYRRVASCEEADCTYQRDGFQICIEPDDEKRDLRIAGIRTAGRNHGEFLVVAGSVQQVELVGISSGEISINPFALKEQDGTWFVFPPGEDCFRSHTMLNGKDPIFEHASGSMRVIPGSGGKITDTRHNKRVVDGDEWKERMNENADAINRAIAKG